MYLYTASVGNLVDQADHKIKESEEVERAVAALFKNFPVKPRVGEECSVEKEKTGFREMAFP